MIEIWKEGEETEWFDKVVDGIMSYEDTTGHKLVMHEKHRIEGNLRVGRVMIILKIYISYYEKDEKDNSFKNSNLVREFVEKELPYFWFGGVQFDDNAGMFSEEFVLDNEHALSRVYVPTFKEKLKLFFCMEFHGKFSYFNYRPKHVVVFTGSDLRNYGGGEKDVINWVSRLKDEIDITVYTPEDSDTTRHRIKKEDLPDINIVWYKGKKIRLLKDVLPLQKFDLSEYDKVYSMCQGFLLNRKLIPHSKKFLLGIHAQSTLATEPIEAHKAWKRFLFKLLYPIEMHYIKKADEIRIQNKDDERRLHEIGFKGKIWNVPPCMFDTTPEPLESNEFYVIWFNRVSPEKRPEKLVELSIMLPKIQFHAIGSGPMDHLFNDKPNIKKMGFLPENELSLELQKAGVCVLTSRGENFGMSAVEAQAYGVPTIAYDVMGLRDYNEVKQTTNEIALRILDYYHEFLEDRQTYMQKRETLRDYGLQRFSNQTVIPQIKEMMTQ